MGGRRTGGVGCSHLGLAAFRWLGSLGRRLELGDDGLEALRARHAFARISNHSATLIGARAGAEVIAPAEAEAPQRQPQ